jgi:hypothetical protein
MFRRCLAAVAISCIHCWGIGGCNRDTSDTRQTQPVGDDSGGGPQGQGGVSPSSGGGAGLAGGVSAGGASVGYDPTGPGPGGGGASNGAGGAQAAAGSGSIGSGTATTCEEAIDLGKPCAAPPDLECTSDVACAATCSCLDSYWHCKVESCALCVAGIQEGVSCVQVGALCPGSCGQTCQCDGAAWRCHGASCFPGCTQGAKCNQGVSCTSPTPEGCLLVCQCKLEGGYDCITACGVSPCASDAPCKSGDACQVSAWPCSMQCGCGDSGTLECTGSCAE